MLERIQSIKEDLLRYEDLNPKLFREFKNDILESIGILATVICVFSIGDLMNHGPGIVPIELIFYFVVFLILGVIMLSLWRLWEKFRYEIENHQEESQENNTSQESNKMAEFNS